jgi:hypothetical protein
MASGAIDVNHKDEIYNGKVKITFFDLSNRLLKSNILQHLFWWKHCAKLKDFMI